MQLRLRREESEDQRGPSPSLLCSLQRSFLSSGKDSRVLYCTYTVHIRDYSLHKCVNVKSNILVKKQSQRYYQYTYYLPSTNRLLVGRNNIHNYYFYLWRVSIGAGAGAGAISQVHNWGTTHKQLQASKPNPILGT